jgi:hypothetical protein
MISGIETKKPHIPHGLRSVRFSSIFEYHLNELIQDKFYHYGVLIAFVGNTMNDKSDSTKSRRKFLSAIGCGVGAAIVPNSTSASLQDGRSKNLSKKGVTSGSTKTDDDPYPKVIYDGKYGEIKQIGRQTYSYHAKSKSDYERLFEKLDEIKGDQTDIPSTQTHSDSGSDEDSFFYRDHQGVCSGDCTADANNGELTFDGTTQASWYGEGYWVEDEVVCESISIDSTVKAQSEKRDASSISVPPGYDVSEDEEEATFSTGPIEQDVVSLSHDPGAVTFYAGDGNCWNWAEQDDTFKFKFKDGHTHFAGYSIRLDNIGHCGII